jgi:hypothetical protein
MLILIRGALRVSAVFLVCGFGLLSVRPTARAAASPSDPASSDVSAPTAEQVEFFEKRIRPILSQNATRATLPEKDFPVISTLTTGTQFSPAARAVPPSCQERPRPAC